MKYVSLFSTPRAGVGLVVALSLLVACGGEEPATTNSNNPVVNSTSPEVDMSNTLADMRMNPVDEPDMRMDTSDPDMRVDPVDEPDMAVDQDMRPDDLCDPNPCTEDDRNICDERNGTVICSCNDGFSDKQGVCEPDPVCGNNPCTEPNRGQCVERDGLAECRCDDGYIDMNGACVLEDPCGADVCNEPNRGVCAAGPDQTVTCSCDVGFVDVDGACATEDPCASSPCTEPGRGVCNAQGGVAVCSCDDGLRDDGMGACVPADPCDPNPCTAANKTACSVEQDQAVCACDVGYQDDGSGGCEVIPPPSCTDQHDTGDMFEPDECVALATTFVLGTTQSHTIEPAGDLDFVSFAAQANEILEFKETESTDTHATLYDSDGVTVLRSTDNETWRWEFEDAGTYYVRWRHYSNSRTGPTTYGVESLGFDDHGDDTSTATTSPTMLSSLVGDLETRGDHDVFAITVDAGRILRFADQSSSDLFFRLYDTDGVTLLRGTDNESWRWEFEDAGTYYVDVRHYSSTAIGDFDVEVQDLGFDDHGDDTSTATTSPTMLSSLVGDLETRGDHDVFAITVDAGRILRFEEGGSIDVFFRLYDTDGVTVLRSTDNESWRWEFEDAGTYYVDVRHYSSRSIGAFDVEIQDLGFDDHGDDPTMASVGMLATPIMGEIETRGDVDYYAFTAEAGHIYRIEETTSTDVKISLRDAAGNVLTSRDSPEWIQWEFATGGTFIVGISHSFSIRTGAYQLEVTDLGLDDHGDLPGAGTAVTMTQTIDGLIETNGDRDVFEITTTSPGEIWRIEETTNRDVIMTLFDTDGVTALYTASSTERIAWSFDQPGTYSVSLRHGSSISIGDYTVEFEQKPADDHSDSLTAPSSIATDGTALMGDISHSGDVDWFSFTTTSGQVYSVDISGSSSFKFTLYDSTGSTSLGSKTNGSIFPTLDAATTYLIKVESTREWVQGTYTLTVSD